MSSDITPPVPPVNCTNEVASSSPPGRNATPVEVDPQWLQTLAVRRRRLLRTLGDLGLAGIVGERWVTVRADGEGFDFGSLSAKATDRLLQLLEDLADHTAPVIPVVVGQESLFGDGEVFTTPIVAPPAARSSVHLVVTV